MTYPARAALLLGLAALLPFCSSSNNGTACDVGVVQACQCQHGEQGTRTCLPDQTAWGACNCDKDGGAGAGGAAGASGSSGTGGSAGSGASGGGAGQDGSAGSSGSGGASGSSGAGGASGDAGVVDGGSCPAGSATNLSGSCDIVAQDCGGALTCSVVQGDAGQYQTACADLGNGSAGLGDTCASHQDCAAGLRCVLGKCTRACCSALEGPLCGANGACDLDVTYGGGAFVTVCTFAPPCTLWTHDCPSGLESDCHVAGGGKFKCSVPNYNQDAGSTEGQACTYVNDCEDSQYCLYAGADAGAGTCRWLCKASNTGAPDAGSVGGGPGLGGCPGGQTCHAFGSPAWLGVCEP